VARFLRLFRKRSKEKDSPISTLTEADSGPIAITSVNPECLIDIIHPSLIGYNDYLGLKSPGILDLCGTYNSKLFDIGVNVENPNYIFSKFSWNWGQTEPVTSWWDYVNNDVSIERMLAPSEIDSIISQEEIFADLLNDRQNASRHFFTNRLLSLIETEYFEYGIDNNADSFVAEYMKTDPIMTKEWLNSLFLDNFANPSVLAKLLRIVSQFDYQEISPEGPTMAALTLNHKNLEVQECSVRAFESWRSIKSLEILENLKVADGWLQKYIDKVVMYLRRDFNVVPSKED
jgi:hypothetical protein